MTSCQHGKRSIRTNTRFCLKAETGVTLYEHESLIIFDEVQLFPQARQAVEAYVEGKNFSEIDMVKRQIISLYEDDLKKIDASGRISALYHAIPAQLSKDSRKYRITSSIGKKNNTRAEELWYELIDSKTILPCYNSTDPRVSLADTKDFDSYKLYLADTGFLYENLVAQMIAASGRELYYHTWEKAGSAHYYEVDFLISEGSKVNAFEMYK